VPCCGVGVLTILSEEQGQRNDSRKNKGLSVFLFESQQQRETKFQTSLFYTFPEKNCLRHSKT
jgi:hypothetical protein